MGIILSSYKKEILNDVLTSIGLGLSNYYIFAANPIEYTGSVPTLTNDDYNDKFIFDWQMIFGKKLNSSNILPVIKNNLWANGTIYTQYDNTSNTLYSNTNYYVVSPPSTVGAPYQIYKCIYNSNNNPSTIQPSLVQQSTFTTTDGYMWRYITSISSENYDKFASSNFVPLYPNTSIQYSAATYAGIDVVVVVDEGQGYNTYYNGKIQGGNSSVLQIDSSASSSSNFYNNCAIYVNNNLGFAQLKIVNNYTVNSSGNWVTLNSPLSGAAIGSVSYSYNISPQVYFNTDGSTDPAAYSVINPSTNSISNIVIIDPGSNISWANVSIYTNFAFTGSNYIPATVYPIVPPPGGHGSDPMSELQTVGFGVYFYFANNETGNIPTNISYNKVGILKNPYTINSTSGAKTSIPYTANTFNQLLVGNVTTTFSVGTVVVGSNSSALGTVAFCNSSVIYLTGDKYFQNNEVIYNNSNPFQNCALVIANNGNIYTKDLNPLYITNISNINRSNTQTEAYNFVVQI